MDNTDKSTIVDRTHQVSALALTSEINSCFILLLGILRHYHLSQQQQEFLIKSELSNNADIKKLN